MYDGTYRVFLRGGGKLGLPPILGPLPDVSYDVFNTKYILFWKFCDLKIKNMISCFQAKLQYLNIL